MNPDAKTLRETFNGETDMNIMTTKRMWSAMVIAVALGAGCGSQPKAQTRTVDEPADLAEQNRMLVRMALAENVHNAVTTERTVYPKDFEPGTARLSELGSERVEKLVYACSGAGVHGRVVVVKGDADDELYDARVAAVRDGLADAGVDLKDVIVAK